MEKKTITKMEKKTINLVATLKEANEVQNELTKLRNKYDQLQKDIEIATSEPFSPLRDKIVAGLMENMTMEALEKIKEREDRELRRRVNGVTVFEVNNVFNPKRDSFQIQSIRFNEEHTKVKVKVECNKNRQYLGISGCWIPDTYETIWLDPKDLIAEVRINLKSDYIS